MAFENYEEAPRERWDGLATAGVFLLSLLLLSVWSYPVLHPVAWEDLSVAAGVRPPATPFPGLYRGVLSLLCGGLGIGPTLAVLPWLGRVAMALAATGVYVVLRDILPATLRLRTHIGRIGGRLGRLIAAVSALLFLCAEPVWRSGQVFAPTTLFLCLAVLVAYLFFRFVRRAQIVPLYFCFAVLGLLTGETPLGFVLFVLVVVGVVLSASRASNPAVPLVNPFVDGLVRAVVFRRLVNLYALCFVATVAFDVWQFIHAGGCEAAGVEADLKNMLLIYLKSAWEAVSASMSPVAILFSLLFSFAPFILAIVSLPRAWDDDRFLPYLLEVLYVVVGLVALSQLASGRVFWFWTWLNDGRMVPSDTLLSFFLLFNVATVAFALAVFGIDACCRNYRRIAQTAFPESMQLPAAADLADALGKARRLRRGIFWFVLVAVPLSAVPGRWQPLERGMMSVMADYLEETVAETADCDTMFSDGFYDTLVELLARREGRTLNCLSVRRVSETMYDLLKRGVRYSNEQYKRLDARECAIRLRAAREGDQGAEDRKLLGISSFEALRTWLVADTNRLARTAVQGCFELWRRGEGRRSLPPLAGVVALPGGVAPERLTNALQTCSALADRIYELAVGTNRLDTLGQDEFRRRVARQRRIPDLELRDKYPCAGFQLARLAKERSRVHDEAGRRPEAMLEAAMADELESVNYYLPELREATQWTRGQNSGVLTPREGLVIGLARADFAFAGQYAEPILKADPDDPRANFALGMRFFQEKQWSRAEQHLERCLVRRPNEIAVLNNLAIVQMKQGNLADAERNARRALELHPELPELRKTLENVLKLKMERKDGKK